MGRAGSDSLARQEGWAVGAFLIDYRAMGTAPCRNIKKGAQGLRVGDHVPPGPLYVQSCIRHFCAAPNDRINSKGDPDTLCSHQAFPLGSWSRPLLGDVPSL